MQFKSLMSIILIVIKLLISQSFANEEFSSVFENIKMGRWAEAEKIARASGNNALLNIVLSQKFLDTKYLYNDFVGAIKFIEQNNHWVGIPKLMEKAEEYLNINTNPEIIFDWFSKNSPKTGIGYKFYALAGSKILKDKSKLSTIIKDGWIYGSFAKDEETRYLNNFGSFLQEKDHVRKIDEKLWNSDTESAKKLMYLVGNGYKKSFTTQIAMMNKKYNAKELFKNIPEKYRTPGLVFRYLECRKKEKPNADIVNLFRKLDVVGIHHAEWSKLQLYYAREFLEHKDFIKAYQILKKPLAIRNQDSHEIEWLSGFITLRFLHKPDLAIQHFTKLSEMAKTPITKSRAIYWLARSNESLGKKELANSLYREASSKYPQSFYGQVSNVELKKTNLILPSKLDIETTAKRDYNREELLSAIRLLVKYNQTELVNIYAKSAIQGNPDQQNILAIMEIAKVNNSIYQNLEIAKSAFQNGVFIKNYAFPIPYNITNIPVEAALSYAIIRQESVFNQHAISQANAMGLMQLIKSTACRTAHSIGTKCDVTKLTKDAKYNIKLGTNHLKDLLKEHEGSYILAIASYNAGSHRIKKWLDLLGDPRKMKDIRQVIDWLELIPYSETRNYVQRVLENIQVYRTILNKNNKLYLKDDLLSHAPKI